MNNVFSGKNYKETDSSKFWYCVRTRNFHIILLISVSDTDAQGGFPTYGSGGDWWGLHKDPTFWSIREGQTSFSSSTFIKITQCNQEVLFTFKYNKKYLTQYRYGWSRKHGCRRYITFSIKTITKHQKPYHSKSFLIIFLWNHLKPAIPFSYFISNRNQAIPYYAI